MNIIISNSSGEPIYEQISTQIKNQIFSGDLWEGMALPSIRSLAKDLKISVITTKRAYEELENEGYIYTLPGKGSYVSSENTELLKEQKLKFIEDKLAEAVDASKILSLSLDTLKEMLEILYTNK